MNAKLLLVFIPFALISCYSASNLYTLNSKKPESTSGNELTSTRIEIDNYQCNIELPELKSGSSYDLKVRITNTSNQLQIVTPQMIYITYFNPISGSKQKDFAANPLLYRLAYEKALAREEMRIRSGYYGYRGFIGKNAKILIEELNRIDQYWLKRTTLFPNEFVEGTVQISIPDHNKSLKLFFSDGLNTVEIPLRPEKLDNRRLLGQP